MVRAAGREKRGRGRGGRRRANRAGAGRQACAPATRRRETRSPPAALSTWPQVFGVQERQTGVLQSMGIDGLLGLDRTSTSFVSQAGDGLVSLCCIALGCWVARWHMPTRLPAPLRPVTSTARPQRPFQQSLPCRSLAPELTGSRPHTAPSAAARLPRQPDGGGAGGQAGGLWDLLGGGRGGGGLGLEGRPGGATAGRRGERAKAGPRTGGGWKGERLHEDDCRAPSSPPPCLHPAAACSRPGARRSAAPWAPRCSLSTTGGSRATPAATPPPSSCWWVCCRRRGCRWRRPCRLHTAHAPPLSRPRVSHSSAATSALAPAGPARRHPGRRLHAAAARTPLPTSIQHPIDPLPPLLPCCRACPTPFWTPWIPPSRRCSPARPPSGRWASRRWRCWAAAAATSPVRARARAPLPSPSAASLQGMLCLVPLLARQPRPPAAAPLHNAGPPACTRLLPQRSCTRRPSRCHRWSSCRRA